MSAEPFEIPTRLPCAEEGCEEPIVGYIDSKAVCETHLAAEFERRVGAGEPVALAPPGTMATYPSGMTTLEADETVLKRAEKVVEAMAFAGTDHLARPGSIVLYRLYDDLEQAADVILPALVVATPGSRAEALERAGRQGADLLAWFPDFENCDELTEPVHLAVFNPEPQRPLLFVPRVGRGEGAGEWRWP